MTVLNEQVLQTLKGFNWQKVNDFSNSLDDLNDAQWRFIKGLIIELMVEDSSNSVLQYVGAVHKDFDWVHGGDTFSVELKSQFSDSMYKKDGNLKKRFSIKLSNSNGTNKQAELNPNNVADILIVTRNDGAFVIDKDTVMRNAVMEGDGFSVVVPNSEIIEFSGKLSIVNKLQTNLKGVILQSIKDAMLNAFK
jgi:hypothetical protein